MQKNQSPQVVDSTGFFNNGGGTGIRTLEPREGLLVFKTSAFNHSAIPPRKCESNDLMAFGQGLFYCYGNIYDIFQG